MKLFIVAVTLLTTILQASTIRWYGLFESALRVSQAEKRPMFVVLVERECDECRRLFATTLMQKRIVRLVNEKTVPVIVTRENEDYPIELLYTLDYPTIFLLSPEEVLLKPPISGAVDAALLEKEILDE